MTALAVFALIYLGWLAVCAVADHRAARQPRPTTDPCAESRAASSALRAYYRSLGDAR